MQRLLLVLLVAAVATVPASGCRSPRIRERPIHPRPTRTDSAPRHLAHTSGVLEAAEAEQVFEALRARVESAATSPAGALLDLAECASALGQRRQKSAPVQALAWHRDAAAYAAFALPIATNPDDHARALDLHNTAVERLLRTVGSGPDRPNPSWREQLDVIGVTITQTSPERAHFPLDELWIARDFRVRNLARNARDGLGVPVVTLSRFPDRQRLPDRFYPARTRLAATAVLVPGGPLAAGAWRAAPTRLVLHNPAQEADLPGATPLAADLTTPLAHQVIQSPLNEIAYGGLLRPEAYTEITGIFMGEPYRPGAIPVLFVHGLWSSPATWLRMVNTLQADPVVRHRYQFWYAIYPTGNVMMLSASRLRAALHDLRNTIDPSHSDSALDQMVVVGHSMGGVLSRQMLLDSGDTLTRALFTRPFDQVVLSPDSREKLSRLLIFQREASIGRVVMIAAPHQGSNVANQLLGRATTAMVRRSSDMKRLHDEIVAQNGREVLHPRYRRRLPSGVDNLASDSPILQILEGLPSTPDVPLHSIIPVLDPGGPRFLQTDAVVAYHSAHREDTRSEVIIQGTHFCTGLPTTTAEVHHLLRLHLTEQNANATPFHSSSGPPAQQEEQP